MAIAVPQQDREINGHLYRVDRGGVFLLKHETFGWVNERTIHHEQRPWRPLERVEPVAPDGSPGTLADDTEFWANSHYLVHRRTVYKPGSWADPNDPDRIACVHLSMRTVENDTRHDWREMQRVKNELCGMNWEAAELYPDERRVVDMANQWHLWAFPFALPFGFPEGIRAEHHQDGTGAVQRPGAGEAPVSPSEGLRAAAEQAGATIPHTFHDPAAPCTTDHAARCCKAHGTHSMPHVGCVLR